MRYGKFALTVIVALVGATAVVSGQAPSAPTQKAGAATASAKTKTSRPAKIPRTLDGKPDFSGIWSAFILQPLQRPPGAKEFFTEEERAELEKTDQQKRRDLRIYPTVTPPGEKTTDAYNTFWRDGFWTGVAVPMLRTSQIVDPPDGRLPPVTAEAQQRQEDARTRQNRPAWGPEDRPLWTRCVRGQLSGPPLVGSGGASYNNNLQIVQSPDHVVIIQEMNHEAQIVPLDGRPHLPQDVKLNKGNSRGRWEGDTLVIESTNFLPSGVTSVGQKMNTDKFHVVERYQLLNPDSILYRFTVEDPGAWTKQWSAEFVIVRMKDQKMLVEYACHEGNRSLEYALSGARVLEAAGITDTGGGGDEEDIPR